MNTDATCNVCVKEQHPNIHELNGGTRGGKWQRMWERERRLITAAVLLILLMNITLGRYILYPFVLFSTWIHEMCHGISAILVGGRVASLRIYADGSGLAYTSLPSGNYYNIKRAFVASAGYTGTAITGGILLLFRRTMRGPRIGTIGVGIAMLLSCIFWIRNVFGGLVIALIGLVLVACGYLLGAGRYLGTIYTFLAVTACLNAITSIRGLLEADEFFVGGEERSSDAETVAQYIGMTSWFWAACWLIQALVMLVVGTIFGLSPSKPAAPETQEEYPSGPYYNVTVV